MSMHRHYIRNELSYIRLTLADQKNSHSILKLVSQGIHSSINPFGTNLPVCTKHSTLGCITDGTCSNPSSLFHFSFTLLPFPPKVCIRIYPMPSDSRTLPISPTWSLSFHILPKLVFAFCLEIAEAWKLTVSVLSPSPATQTSSFTPL